jgi:hypothetical protein
MARRGAAPSRWHQQPAARKKAGVAAWRRRNQLSVAARKRRCGVISQMKRRMKIIESKKQCEKMPKISAW